MGYVQAAATLPKGSVYNELPLQHAIVAVRDNLQRAKGYMPVVRSERFAAADGDYRRAYLPRYHATEKR